VESGKNVNFNFKLRDRAKRENFEFRPENERYRAQKLYPDSPPKRVMDYTSAAVQEFAQP
jgi:hypothetical protein